MNNPFTITVEFNFIRFVKSFAKNYHGFNDAEDSLIRVAEDNYINRRIWHDWDSSLIKNLAEVVPEVCRSFAKFIMSNYIEDFELNYFHVTIKQIEFNKDFYVGRHKASEVLNKLHSYVSNASGVDWVSSLRGYAISYYSSEDCSKEPTHAYGDLYSPTLKIPINKGIFFKIYRKTTDDIRFEVTFQKDFIRKVSKKQAFDCSYSILRESAKDFVRKSKFSKILSDAVECSYPDNFSFLKSIFDFTDLVYPELSIVYECIMFGNIITNPKDIKLIRSNNRLSYFFSSGLMQDGRPFLSFNLNKPRNVIVEKDNSKEEFLKDMYRSYKQYYPNDTIYLSKNLMGIIHRKSEVKREVIG